MEDKYRTTWYTKDYVMNEYNCRLDIINKMFVNADITFSNFLELKELIYVDMKQKLQQAVEIN